jgi:hypothetical protein
MERVHSSSCRFRMLSQRDLARPRISWKVGLTVRQALDIVDLSLLMMRK